MIAVTSTAPGAAVSIMAGPGNDVITMGDGAGSVGGIVGPVTIDGDIGFNSLTVDDSSDETGDRVALSNDGLGAEEGDDLFGQGGSLGYAGFTLLTLTTGTGPDTIDITGTPTALIALGVGSDRVLIADNAVLAGTIDGGLGIDTISYEAVKGPVTASLGTGNATATNGILAFETLIGGSGKDNLTGQNSLGSTLMGGPGNDTLTGGTGNDVLDGGAGSDRLYGSQGNDSYALTQRGRDRVIDPSGRDELDFSGSSGKVVVNLSKSKNERQRLRKGGVWLQLLGRIENVIGSRFNDRIIGSKGKNVLLGKAGNDRLTGLSGNDRLDGGGGKDKLIETADTDFTLTPTRLKGLGKDKLKAFESAALTGGDGHNVLSAQRFRGRVVLRGGLGDDTLEGGRKGDLLIGEDGDDTLIGGNGKDQYVAGGGTDTLLMKDRTPDRADAGDGYDRASFDTADRLTSVEGLAAG